MFSRRVPRVSQLTETGGILESPNADVRHRHSNMYSVVRQKKLRLLTN